MACKYGGSILSRESISSSPRTCWVVEGENGRSSHAAGCTMVGTWALGRVTRGWLSPRLPIPPAASTILGVDAQPALVRGSYGFAEDVPYLIMPRLFTARQSGASARVREHIESMPNATGAELPGLSHADVFARLDLIVTHIHRFLQGGGRDLTPGIGPAPGMLVGQSSLPRRPSAHRGTLVIVVPLGPLGIHAKEAKSAKGAKNRM
jgi:hypothetical protein